MEKDLWNELQKQHQLAELLGREQAKESLKLFLVQIKLVIELDVKSAPPSLHGLPD